MCGIVGYIGKNPSIDILLNGLSKLEYRGYDSAGVAFHFNNKVEVYKEQGKLSNLKKLLDNSYSRLSQATIGIGHIRWATHGAPNTINAHPHQCNCGILLLIP